MRSKKERLEFKIRMTITRMDSAPLREKEKYSLRLEKYFNHYKELTGETYKDEQT